MAWRGFLTKPHQPLVKQSRFQATLTSICLGLAFSFFGKCTSSMPCLNTAFTLSASAFDPRNRDENVDYYVAKLDELVKKFGGVAASNAKPEQQESLAL